MLVASGITAVDIGASGIRVLRMGQRRGQFEIASAASIDLHSGLAGARGRVEPAGNDAETTPDHIREIRTNLASLLRRGQFRAGRSVIALGGNAGLIRYLQVPPVPPWKMELIMKYEVDEQMGNNDTPAYDYRILDLPDVGGQLTTMLTMVQERNLISTLDLAHRAGLPRCDVELNPVGLYNAYMHCHGGSSAGTVLLVDIGASTIGICLVQNGNLTFARSVPGGGARFTDALAQVAGLDVPEAEKLKRERGRILGDADKSEPIVVIPEPVSGTTDDIAGGEDGATPPGYYVEQKISSVLLREVGALAGTIESTLMYCRAQTKQAKLRPDEVLLAGGGCMLPGLEEALALRMRLPVSRLEPFRKVSLGSLPREQVEEISAQAPRYAVAMGMAVSRMVGGAVTTSLVPEAVKARRRFLASDIWMWYTAAAIFVAALLAGYVPVRNERLLAAEKDRRQGLLEKAEKDDAEFRGLHSATMQRQAEVKALEERVHSGRDVVQLLSLLRKATGGSFMRSIVLTEVNNRPPTVVPDATPEEREQSFQKSRRTYVRGYASAPVGGGNAGDAAAQAKASQEALGLIEKYRHELETLGKRDGFVDNAITRYYPPRPDEKVLDTDGVARHEFVIELVLAEPRGNAGKQLAAGKGGDN